MATLEIMYGYENALRSRSCSALDDKFRPLLWAQACLDGNDVDVDDDDNDGLRKYTHDFRADVHDAF